MEPYQILVIDDDHQIAAILEMALQSQGYTTSVAHDPREGMSAACRLVPNLILLDYNLPGKDGLTLLNDMRSIPDLENVPVIFVTAVAIPEIVNQALASGVMDFLVKPFDLKTLYSRVERALITAPVEV
jgi:DNA-binding response OmpR family regulator